MKKPDVVIIGTGVLGFSTALSMLQEDPTLNLTLIGRKAKKGSATLAAGAMLGCYGEITETHLNTLHGKIKFDCSLKAKQMWDNWITFVNEKAKDNKKINKGTFIVNNSISGNIDSKNYRTIKKVLLDNNEPFEEINFEDIPGINTLENNRALQTIYIPEEGYLCGQTWLDTLEKAALSYKGFCHVDSEVLKLNVSKNKIHNVTLEFDKFIETPVVILAAGAFSQKLLDQIPELTTRIPRILSGVGHSLLLSQQENKKIQHVIRTPNRAGACGLHVLPYEDNLYVGATNEIKMFPDTTPTAGWVHFLLECALEQINQNLFSSQVRDIKVGNRPSPVDGFPLMGGTSISNLILLTGTYRDGFHQSPYLASLISQYVLNQEPILNNIFQPERNPIQTMSREEAILEAVEHQMASAYEAGAKLPPAFWDKALMRYLENDIRELYVIIGADINLLPEHTLMLREQRHNSNIIKSFQNCFSNVYKTNKIADAPELSQEFKNVSMAGE